MSTNSDRGYLRSDPHDTEIEAAESVRDTAPTARARILRWIADAEAGLTDDEIRETAARENVRMAWSSTSARRKELYDAGLVEDSGQRRSTWAGRSAIVWVLTEQGQRVA